MFKWLLILYCSIVFLGCSSRPEMSQAKSYEVLKVKDIGAFDRTRKDAVIFSADAKSPEECAQTAMKAAQELRNKYTVLVMRVFIEKDKNMIGQGNISARAVWAPDGQGFSGVEGKEWEVHTLDGHGEHPYEPK